MCTCIALTYLELCVVQAHLVTQADGGAVIVPVQDWYHLEIEGVCGGGGGGHVLNVLQAVRGDLEVINAALVGGGRLEGDAVGAALLLGLTPMEHIFACVLAVHECGCGAQVHHLQRARGAGQG